MFEFISHIHHDHVAIDNSGLELYTRDLSFGIIVTNRQEETPLYRTIVKVTGIIKRIS